MTDDLIERLRAFVVERGKVACGSDIVSACNNSALSLSDLRALLGALEAARNYAEGNPLGGPAARFDVMASRIRAGEPEDSVLADYGLCRAAELEGALEAAREDGERYRWIRSSRRTTAELEIVLNHKGGVLDAAIDAAREARND